MLCNYFVRPVGWCGYEMGDMEVIRWTREGMQHTSAMQVLLIQPYLIRCLSCNAVRGTMLYLAVRLHETPARVCSARTNNRNGEHQRAITLVVQRSHSIHQTSAHAPHLPCSRPPLRVPPHSLR